jgi:hypothetical protein
MALGAFGIFRTFGLRLRMEGGGDGGEDWDTGNSSGIVEGDY